MKLSKRFIKGFIWLVLAVAVVNFLMVRMGPSVFLYIVFVIVIIGGMGWFLFRILFLISGRLGYRKTVHKKTVIASTILLFVAFTWIPWWQYTFLPMESLSQKEKLNMAPIYWRFLFSEDIQAAHFVRDILNRRFEDKKSVQELVGYLKKSGFKCRKFKLLSTNKSTGDKTYEAGTSCKNRHWGFIFENIWHVSINHEDNLIDSIYVRQNLDAI